MSAAKRRGRPRKRTDAVANQKFVIMVDGKIGTNCAIDPHLTRLYVAQTSSKIREAVRPTPVREFKPDDIEAALRRQPAQECPSAKEEPVDDEAEMEAYRQANPEPIPDCKIDWVDAGSPGRPLFAMPTNEQIDIIAKRIWESPAQTFVMPSEGQINGIFSYYRGTEPPAPDWVDHILFGTQWGLGIVLGIVVGAGTVAAAGAVVWKAWPWVERIISP